MAGSKLTVTFELQEDLVRMLEAAAAEYGLADRSKALRCVLDYVANDGDWEEIFGDARCNRCGGRPGWTPREQPA